MMKTKHSKLAAFVLAGIALASMRAWGQPAGKTGLSALLANDDRLITELVVRDMETLQQYMFKKNNVPPDQQAAYKAVISVRQLDNPNIKLNARQQQELISNVSRGIDKVLPTLSDAEDLMKLAKVLVEIGEAQAINMLECWGEDPRTQAQLRPIADAVAKVYQKAAVAAEAERAAIEKQITSGNQAQWRPAGKRPTPWRSWRAIAGRATSTRWRFRSITRTSCAEVCEAGIDALKKFDDPDSPMDAWTRFAIRNTIAKLLIAQGTAQSCREAKTRFARTLKDAPDWGQKWDAVFFRAVADLMLKDLPAVRQSAAAVRDWIAKNPPPAENAAQTLKVVDAWLDMLTFRICSVEAEQGDPVKKKQADDAAMAVLQQLLAKCPDLQWAINQQMMLRLPENPNVEVLPALLLKAMQRRGYDEVAQDATAAVNKGHIMQAVAAAREIIRRVDKAPAGKDLTLRDAEDAAILLGFFYARVESHLDAAVAFMDFIDKYRASDQRNTAFENAFGAIVAMRKMAQPPTEFRDVYIRFLQIATSPPFSRKEFSFEYADLLLRRNNGLIETGNYDEKRKAQMIADAQQAAGLLHSAPADRKLQATYLEMVAYDQMVDLTGRNTDLRPQVMKINELADAVNKLIDEQLPKTSDKQVEMQLRTYKALTGKLVAELARHETGPNKKAVMEKALALLDNIRETVKGLPDADAMVADALRARIDLKMGLDRAAEAMSDLEEVLKGLSAEDGVRLTARMVQSLQNEFQQAKQQDDEPRMAELAGCIAKLADYVVQRAEQSSDAQTRKLLPEFKEAKASANLMAASMAKDPAQRRKYNQAALEFYNDLLKRAKESLAKANEEAEKAPNDAAKQAKAKDELAKEKIVELQVARVQYEVGEPETLGEARRTFAEFILRKYLGGPMNAGQYNDPYWEVTYKLLDCNARLLQGADLESTKSKLKELYILWDGQPGGPKWTKEFDKLRNSLLPGWAPPPPGKGPSTRASTQP